LIRSSRPADPHGVARHYDELDPFYRALWGEHLHHGLWTTGRETPARAALALVDEVLRRARVRPGAAVCDVGCGYGAVTRVLAERGMEATGLTISRAQYDHAQVSAGTVGPAARPSRPAMESPSEELVGTAHQQFLQTAWEGPGPAEPPRPTPRFLLRDWLDNRLPDAGFDAVLAIESLSHMADPVRAVAEAARVLKPGGRFVACVWLTGPSPRRWEIRHLLRPICDEGRLTGLPHGADHIEWARGAGLVEVDLEDVSDRVARTWRVCAIRLGRALARRDAWRYLMDRENTERTFALTVFRLLVAYRTGAMRYGILTATKPVL
jgi:tocopherol O-methyltransferase